MWRREVKPFTENQINLVKTFADQAVIAIENVRLFQELKESLEQQTATSEILGVIASSPTDIQPVLDVVAENAARLCGTTRCCILHVDGDMLRVIAAHSGSVPGSPSTAFNPMIATLAGRAVLERTDCSYSVTSERSQTNFPKVECSVQDRRIELCLPFP